VDVLGQCIHPDIWVPGRIEERLRKLATMPSSSPELMGVLGLQAGWASDLKGIDPDLDLKATDPDGLSLDRRRAGAACSTHRPLSHGADLRVPATFVGTAERSALGSAP
jgi:hypothetical protein